MTEAIPAKPDTIVFSNVTLVRNQDGDLSVYVGNEKIIGLAVAQITQGQLGMSVPMNRVRLSEDTPATPVVIEKKDNVLSFPKFRAIIKETPPDTVA